MLLKQSTTYNRVFKMIDSADHFSKKTGLTPTVNLSKNGGSFGAAGGTVSEIANGWYLIALTTTDTNTVGDLAFYITATGADDTDFCDQVGVRNLDDLAYPATSGRSMVVDSAGLVDANMVKHGPSGSGTAVTAGALPAAVAGAASGLLVAGSNAATTFASFTVTATLQVGGVFDINGGVDISNTNATGNGITITAGSTSGDGIRVTSGPGTGSAALHLEGAGSGGGTYGIYCLGQGTGNGIKCDGGATGAAIYAIGGLTSGEALHLQGRGGNAAIEAIGGATAGSGAKFSGGAGGHGLELVGDTAGAGLSTTGGSAGRGLSTLGGGNQPGIYSGGGATGQGAAFIGGSTSGNGMTINGQTLGNGLVINGAGAAKHGCTITGAVDGLSCIAGTGVSLRAPTVTADITGSITTCGTVGSTDGLGVTARAQVRTEADAALVAIHLDHLLAVDYDPTAKPGVATALLNELVQSAAGVSQFTATALALAPTGGAAPSAATIAQAVWQDTTAGDFTVTNSIGRALYSTAVPGASGGHLIAGSNAATTLASLTCTDALTVSNGIIVTCSTADRSGLQITGNGLGHGAVITSGNGATGNALNITCNSTDGRGLSILGKGTGAGINVVGGTTSGHGIAFAGGGTGDGLNVTGGNSSGNGMSITGGSTNGRGLSITSSGSGHGMAIFGGTTGNGLNVVGGSSSGHGIVGSGSGLGHGMSLTGTGSSRHGFIATGGSAGTSDGMNLVAGTGGVALRAPTTLTDIAGGASPTAIATAVWQDATAGDFTTANSIGKSLYNAFTANTSVFTSAALANAPTGGTAPSAISIAQAVWQDATAGDFTVANSIGRALYSTAVPGAAGGLLIAGTNASLTITDALTISNGIIVTASTTDRPALQLTGNGAGDGAKIVAGATGQGLNIDSTSGDGINVTVATSGHGIIATAVGATKNGLRLVGGSSGLSHALFCSSSSGDGIRAQGGTAANNNGIQALAGAGSAGAGIRATGDTTGSGMHLTGGGTAGTGLTCAGAGNGAGVNFVASGTGTDILGDIILTDVASTAWKYFGILDAGTTLAIPDANHVQLRSAFAAGGDSRLIGHTLLLPTSNESRTVLNNVDSTDTVSVDSITAVGAVSYVLFGTSAGTSSLPAPVDLQTIKGQTVTAAAGVTFPTEIASRTNITAGTITNLTNAPTAGDLTATMKASVTTACTASTPTISSVSGSVGSVAGSVGSVVGNVGGNVVGSVGSVAGNITGNLGGSVGSVVGNVGGNVNGSVATVATGGITAGSIATDAIGANEIAADAVQEIVDRVWDELLVDHSDLGSMGAAMAASGASGDPWATPVPGDYMPGSAGYLIGTSSSGADTAGVTELLTRLTDTRADYLDNLSGGPVALETTAQGIKTRTDTLPATPANEATLTLIKQSTDKLPAVPADQATSLQIKTATDRIPLSPAAVGSPMILAANGLDAVIVESVTPGPSLVNDSGSQLGAINARQALSLNASALSAAVAGAETTSISFKAAGKVGVARIAATVDSVGNRSGINLRVPD